MTPSQGLAPGSIARQAAEREDRIAHFLSLYYAELAVALREYPNEYAWDVTQLPVVFERMASAIRRGSYNKDSRAIKAVCKRLGIPHTYKAISGFFAGA